MTRPNAIRKEIIFQLYAVRPLALSAERIAMNARKDSMDYRAEEVRREAGFLEDEKLIESINEPGTTSVLYRITGEGIRVYEQNFAA